MNTSIRYHLYATILPATRLLSSTDKTPNILYLTSTLKTSQKKNMGYI